uniref:LHFPL tetraspan subfamily member 5a n=1 Tax=Sinocyclocheilus anshuiensis TaxID=1608454 RepID=A0A671MQB0_9TELE
MTKMLSAQEAAKIYHTNYMRNARAVGVLWTIFTICFAIICVVVFIQPYWIGDSVDTPQSGYFGLFHYCIGNPITGELVCKGSALDFGSIPSDAFKTAMFFVGISLLLIVETIVCFSLFFLQLRQRVKDLRMDAAGRWLGCLFEICNPLLQSLVSFFILDHSGKLSWAYILAIISIMDCLILSFLAFVLGNRQDKLLPADFQVEEKKGIDYYKLPSVLARLLESITDYKTT